MRVLPAYPSTLLPQGAHASASQFLPKFSRWSWITLLVAAALQAILFPSFTNLFAIGCVLIAWTVLTKHFLRPPLLHNFPLSVFLVTGFVSTQFYFPLVFTLLEGKPLIFNLSLPDQVFLHSLAALAVLTFAHFVYRNLFRRLSGRRPSLLHRAGFFIPPTEAQLWLMGAAGLATTFYVYLYAATAQQVTGEASDKFLEALIPFSYAPFFIPFSRLYGSQQIPTKRLVHALLVYTLLLFIISIGRNSRGAFMVGFTSVGFAYALGLLLDFYKIKLFTLKNLCFGVLAFWLFTGPIADIGTAMVLVRQQRNDIPYSELIELTFEAFSDKEAIRLSRLESTTEKGDWDEVYVDNIFIARFSNLKFNDTSLLLASQLSPEDPDMFNFTVDHLLATLPQPVLEALAIDVNKEAVIHVSYGDYLLAKVSANPWVLGSFLTGHFAGTGMAAFGWWYLLALGVGIIPVFRLYDVLVGPEPATGAATQPQAGPPLRFSFCGLLALTSIFQFLPTESVEATAGFLLRGWVQLILLYFLMFHFTRRVSLLLPRLGATARKRRPQPL